MHEICHSLGMYHTQMRPDRDEHIKILSKNIKSDKEYNYVKISRKYSLLYDVPYDLTSIMHYEYLVSSFLFNEINYGILYFSTINLLMKYQL